MSDPMVLRQPSQLDRRLEAFDIEERLEDLLGAVLTSRRTAAEPAQKLSRLERTKQDFALDWAGIIAKSNSEMAFQFVSHVSQAFSLLDADGVKKWIIAAMDVYDRDGLYLGSTTLRDVDRFASGLQQKRYAVTFNDVVGVMNKFVTGVAGRDHVIQEGENAWTDTETIYLPQSIARFESSHRNFELYKATVGYLLAQTQYGTFRVDVNSGLPIALMEISKYQDSARALGIFEWVEEHRLLARLESELPGLARQLRALRRDIADEAGLTGHISELARVQHVGASVMDSLSVVRHLYGRNVQPPRVSCYRGIIDLDRVCLVTKQRVEEERDKFRTDLALLAEGMLDDSELEGEEVGRASLEISYTFESNNEALSEGELSITIDGKPTAPPENMMQTARSIFQDFGEIPEDYLVPAGSGLYDAGRKTQDRMESDGVDKKNGVYYDEWDHRRGHYRKNWCILREIDMHPGNPELVSAILNKYFHLVRDLRKSFEALRGDDRLLRRQRNGEDIDIDAVVESYVDIVKGEELSDRLFIKSRKVERNLAVVFMVDVSGSTKGWINEAERESLVLLSEALETLGDRYAIYGFSGMTRKRCEVYRIKAFDEVYDSRVKARIAGMKPQDYTRMGVVIRHLTKKLLQIDAKTRVLITISDGKPDDYDGYRGDYGIEDTRQALVEAKYAGIHPFCVTIDYRAHEYLPHMYGHVNYTVVSDVRKLPLKISDVYRKLTT